MQYGHAYDTCALLEGVTATIGGEPMTINPGAFLSRSDGYPYCRMPRALLDHLPQATDAVFEIRDETRSV